MTVPITQEMAERRRRMQLLRDELERREKVQLEQARTTEDIRKELAQLERGK